MWARTQLAVYERDEWQCRMPSYSRRALSYPVASAFPGNQGSRWS